MPANRFEVLECRAALDAIAENAQDTPPLRVGALDVLAQHVLGCACGEPFLGDELYAEVKTAAPYAALTRADFDAVVDFVATGGYALKAYERFARIRQGKDGRWRIAHPSVAQRYRLNVGTIVEADMLKVRLVRSRASKMIPRGGRLLGEVEEYFVETMVPGDTFVFAGEILKYEALVEDQVYVSRSTSEDPKVPAYEGGKFPLSTYLAARVRGIIAHPQEWRALPAQVREWLEIQEWRSQMPGAQELLVETFPRGNKHYLICYPFEGRLAHQTLGMLLTRRLERARQRPMGFEEARTEFENLARDEFAQVPRDWNWLASMFVLADICVDLGEAKHAEVLYRLLAPYSARNAMLGWYHTYGSIAFALGRLAALLGRFDEAKAHFETALAANARIRATVALAHTRMRARKAASRPGSR